MFDQAFPLGRRSRAKHITIAKRRLPIAIADDELLQLATYGYITVYVNPPSIAFSRKISERAAAP